MPVCSNENQVAPSFGIKIQEKTTQKARCEHGFRYEHQGTVNTKGKVAKPY
jgi:hypothetical protein